METTDFIIMAILLGCLTTYVPVFLSLFIASAVGFMFFLNMPLEMMSQTLFRSLDNFSLIVVLFFVLCGNIMTKGKMVEKLISFANSMVSWLPGGLGMAGVIGCGLFGAISGSTVATVVALGGLCHRPDDDLPEPGCYYPAQYQHDFLFHDQQCLPGRTFSDRVYTGDYHYYLCLPLYLDTL